MFRFPKQPRVPRGVEPRELPRERVEARVDGLEHFRAVSQSVQVGRGDGRGDVVLRQIECHVEGRAADREVQEWRVVLRLDGPGRRGLAELTAALGGSLAAPVGRRRTGPGGRLPPFIGQGPPPLAKGLLKNLFDVFRGSRPVWKSKFYGAFDACSMAW